MELRAAVVLRAAVIGTMAAGLAAMSPGALAADKPPPAPSQSAALTEGAPGNWTANRLPSILGATDVSRYRVIFSLQKNGEWKAADKIIDTLENRVLMGHVLAQRYLHPTKYRSRYRELKAWMDQYADHPDARRIHKLAFRRRPKNWKMPKPPTGRLLAGSGHDGAAAAKVYRPAKRLSRADRNRARQIRRQISSYLRKGWTKAAKQQIRARETRRLFHPGQYDRFQAALGAAYYAHGRYEWAAEWTGRAIKRSGRFIPSAHWTAGLAKWRLGKFDEAAAHFGEVAASDYSSPWLSTAGAFWAARAELKAKRPERVNGWLEEASAYPRTFYGILARRQLGLDVSYNWAPPPLREEALKQLAEAPGGARAVTLLQVGQDRRAERELRYLFRQASPELARAMLALADRARLPSLAMRLGNMLVKSGSSLYDSTAYPVPSLPVADERIQDTALVLALIRQESGFNPDAKSRAGARGLMQIMPRTASFIARDRRYRGAKRRALFDPETNVELGQRYINILLNEPYIGGDLFRMAVAWNAGPGNLRKWQRHSGGEGDPLLFIESIPLRETRIFVERVLTNYWIYRARFGRPTPSLDAVAAGEWPSYHRSGPNGVEVARDERKQK